MITGRLITRPSSRPGISPTLRFTKSPSQMSRTQYSHGQRSNSLNLHSSYAMIESSQLICAPQLRVLADASTCTYTPTADDCDPALPRSARKHFTTESSSVQTREPLNKFGTTVKYFEATVITVNPHGAGITIGLGQSRVLNKKPGMAPRSIGWSSEGLLFCGGPATGQRWFGGR